MEAAWIMQLFDHFAATLPFRKTMEMSSCKYVANFGGALDNFDGALSTCRICQLIRRCLRCYCIMQIGAKLSRPCCEISTVYYLFGCQWQPSPEKNILHTHTHIYSHTTLMLCLSFCYPWPGNKRACKFPPIPVKAPILSLSISSLCRGAKLIFRGRKKLSRFGETHSCSRFSSRLYEVALFKSLWPVVNGTIGHTAM